MTTMVCVARSGGRYDATWVERLARGAKQHIGGLERIVCLTDLPLAIPGVARVPLRHDWPTWWAKMEAFRAGIATGRTALVDLDTLFVGDASTLFAGDGVLALEDFFHHGRLSSAVMAFDAGSLSYVYERFAADPERWMAPGSCGRAPNAVHGDQVVIDYLLREAGEPVGFWQQQRENPIEFYNPHRTLRGPVVVFIGPDKPDTAPAHTRAIWRGERTALAA